jgi:hypothetical protein
MRIAFFITLCLISIPLTIRRPSMGLAFYIGFNIVRPEMLFWSETSGNFIFRVIYGLILSVVLWKGYLSRTYLLANKQTLLMLMVLVGVMLSEVFSLYVGDLDGKYAIELAKNIGFCVLIVLIVSEIEDIVLLQQIILGCSTFLGIWGIVQNLQGNIRVEGLGGASWPDSNYVAAVYVLFLPLAIAQFMTAGKNNMRLLSFGMFTTMIILIVCTQSRAGTVGAAVSILTFGFFAKKIGKTLVLATLITILAVCLAGERYVERMQTLRDMENADASAQSRVTLWQAAAMVFADHPLIGTGFMTYPVAKMEYKDRFYDLDAAYTEEVFRRENMKVTHNTYLQMLSDCGLCGGGAFIALILSAVGIGFSSRNMHRYHDHAPNIYWLNGICAGICGFAVCILTLDMVTNIFIYVQITFAFLLKKTLEDQLAPAIGPKAWSART